MNWHAIESRAPRVTKRHYNFAYIILTRLYPEIQGAISRSLIIFYNCLIHWQRLCAHFKVNIRLEMSVLLLPELLTMNLAHIFISSVIYNFSKTRANKIILLPYLFLNILFVKLWVKQNWDLDDSIWLHHLLYKLSLPGEYLPTNDRSGRVDKGTLRAYVLGITRGFLYSTNFVGKSKYVLLKIIDLLHDCKATKFKFYY